MNNIINKLLLLVKEQEQEQEPLRVNYWPMNYPAPSSEHLKDVKCSHLIEIKTGVLIWQNAINKQIQ